MTFAPFTFRTATEIRFGRGTAAAGAEAIAGLSRRVLLVHGATAARADWLADALAGQGAEVTRIACPREPELGDVEDAVAAARAAGVGVVAGLGGGAALDLAKAVAALAPAPGSALDHLEVVGAGRPLEATPLPFVALPTTAGTGAEVTKNAVIGLPDRARKVSLRDDRMLARLAIVDPALTDNAPRGVTLASGLDAVTQVIEPFLSHRANPLTDALCRAAIPAGLGALARLMQAEDAGARDALAWTSLCGGLALANAGLGAVHGFAGVLGGMTGAAHGEICACLLPHVLMAHARRDDPALAARLDPVEAALAEALGGEAGQGAETLLEWSRHAGIRPLSALGVSARDVPALAAAAQGASSMKANPYVPDIAELERILAAALER